jgi:dolichyl-phosphate-mannose-protein mannosyltransferase
VVHRYASPQDFVAQFRADPSLLYLEARVTSALAGALTVLAAFALGAAWRPRRTGLLAAGWTAVAYLLVRDAHFGVNDALVTLLVTLALAACVRVLRDGSPRFDLLAGALTGLAFTAKYQGLVVLVPLVLACALRPRRRVAGLAVALGSMLLAAVVSFPSLVLEPGRVVGDVYLHLYLPGQTGYAGLDPAGGYRYYLEVLGWGVGWPLLVAAVLGSLLLTRTRATLLVASVPGVLYGVLGAERMYFARLLLPGLPALIVLAAGLLDDLAQRLESRWRQPAAIAFAPVLAVAVSLPLALDSLQLDRVLSRPDTRTQAQAWIDASLPPASRLAVDATPLGAPLPAGRYDLLVADGWSLDDLGLADYQARGVEYLITSSFTAEAPASDAAQAARRTAFYASLRSSAQLVTQFRPTQTPPPFVYDQIYGPFALERPGPTVSVFRLSQAPAATSPPAPAASSRAPAS